MPQLEAVGVFHALASRIGGMEQNPYQSPTIPPASSRQEREESGSAIQLLTEIRYMQHEMLSIYRRTAAIQRNVLIGALVIMVLAIAIALGIFGVAIMRLPNS